MDSISENFALQLTLTYNSNFSRWHKTLFFNHSKIKQMKNNLWSKTDYKRDLL